MSFIDLNIITIQKIIMKRRLIFVMLALAALVPAIQAQSLDLRSILNGISGGTDSTATTSESTTSKLGNLLGNILSNSKVTVQDLTGKWSYSAPAVSFKSDNLLQKAGGVAAATALEGKLDPYYRRAGLTAMTLTVEADSTFTMKVGKVSLKGNLEPAAEGSDANFVMHFGMGGKLSIASMDAYIEKSGSNQMSLMFDVSKLTTLVDMVASLSGSSAAKGVSSLLKSYDGVCAGFKMTK